VAMSDDSLSAITRATHGFSAFGDPMTVTKAEGNRIFELNDRPAWEVYTECLGLNPNHDTICGETIPVGALAERLPENLVEEYGNPHILRVITKRDEDGSIYYPVTVTAGLQFWLTMRDEDLIFNEQERSLKFIEEQLTGNTIQAVFQTDCLARGRFLFNKIMKEELMAMIQQSLSNDGEVPPWLGMYGFGEYAQLGKRNTFHNYSAALLVVYRK